MTRFKSTLGNSLWWQKVAPYYLFHIACLLVFFVPFEWKWVGLCFAIYTFRMFVVTAWYHRYFSHRSFKTSRVVQFIFAFLGCTLLQQGPLWWAAHHRRHHKHSGSKKDIHSPEQKGFYWAHQGWTLSLKYNHSDLSNVKDLTKYPELVFLDKFYTVPAILLGVILLYFGGAAAFVWGWLVSLVLNYHATFFINSLCHMFGRRRFKTTDDSRNSFLLAIITLGEGWHNNHHHYQQSVRQGMYWWELDVSYIILKLMSFVGLVWDLKVYPKRIYEEARQQKLNPKCVAFEDSEKVEMVA